MIKLLEASLPLHQSHDALRSHLSNALMAAHGVMDRYSSNGPYLQDVYDGHVVYSHQGAMQKRSYTKTDTTPPKITLGEPKKVHAAYVDAKESAGNFLAVEDAGDLFSVAAKPLFEARNVMITDLGVDLTESVQILVEVELKEGTGSTARIPVKLIAPGWGSSGYYSADMLKRDGPQVFKEGLHMHMDHATKTEAKESPVRSMRTLAAVLAEDAKWEDNGKEGPGLYSSFEPMASMASRIKETAKYTGVSINARGKVSMGEVAGRKGPIVESLILAKSADFVTEPGAGGKALLESAAIVPTPIKESTTMTEQEQTTLREAQSAAAESKKLLEAALARENQSIAVAYLAGEFQEAGLTVKLPALQRLAANPPLKEGKVDHDAVKAIAKEFIESFGGGKGKKVVKKGVRDLGEAAEVDEDADNLKQLGECYREMGLDEAAVKLVMAGGL